jgi:hypothetical protein
LSNETKTLDKVDFESSLCLVRMNYNYSFDHDDEKKVMALVAAYNTRFPRSHGRLVFCKFLQNDSAVIRQAYANWKYSKLILM